MNPEVEGNIYRMIKAVFVGQKCKKKSWRTAGHGFQRVTRALFVGINGRGKEVDDAGARLGGAVKI